MVKDMAGDRALLPVMLPGGIQRAEGKWPESHQNSGRAEPGRVAAARVGQQCVGGGAEPRTWQAAEGRGTDQGGRSASTGGC